MSKTTVIFHSADYDGIFCREIARKFLPDAELIGWNFGDLKVEIPHEGSIYILDLSPDCLGENFHPYEPGPAGETRSIFDRIIWIDHHKSSIEKWGEFEIPGYRIDGVAACRLAWQWFTTVDGNTPRVGAEIGIPIRLAGVLPMIQDFKNREVNEPIAVRLAGEYDIWDKRDPRADTFQYGLRIENDGAIQTMLVDDQRTERVVERGHTAQLFAQKIDADLVTYRSYRLNWEGLNWIVLNTGRFNSLTFAALDKPETGHDALMGYMFNGKVWTVSLYHAKHRTDLDLSAIAIKYGGGGHRRACGFTCSKLPF